MSNEQLTDEQKLKEHQDKLKYQQNYLIYFFLFLFLVFGLLALVGFSDEGLVMKLIFLLPVAFLFGLFIGIRWAVERMYICVMGGKLKDDKIDYIIGRILP